MLSRVWMRWTLFCTTLLLTACSDDSWFGDEEEEPLPGRRFSVLSEGLALKAEPRLADVSVVSPPVLSRVEWSQHGGNAASAPRHVAGPSEFSVGARVDVGDGRAWGNRLVAAPVVAGGLVYAMDGWRRGVCAYRRCSS